MRFLKWTTAVALVLLTLFALHQSWQAEEARQEALHELANAYWVQGRNERDDKNNPLKAAHYFMRAASLMGDDPVASQNAQLAGRFLIGNYLLAGVLAHQGWVLGAAFSADERRVLTWSDDGTARVWDIGITAEWPREHLVLLVEVQTGTRLTDLGELEVLSAEEWQSKKQQYEEIRRQLDR